MSIQKPLRLALTGLVLAVAGCATGTKTKNPKYPMHASLDWLTAEAGPVRTINSFPFQENWIWKSTLIPLKWLGFGVVSTRAWDQRTIISISGGLEMPMVGDAYFWDNNASPVQSICVFRPHNATWLTQTIPASPKADVFTGKAALDALQFETQEAISLGIEEIGLSYTNSRSREYSDRLLEIRRKIKATQSRMMDLRKCISTNLNQPGVVVFRWARKVESGGGITADTYASANWKNGDTETGYGILNGLKAVALIPGDEWTTNYVKIKSNLGNRPEKQIGVVTYLMQASNVVYVRDLEMLRSFTAQMDIGKIVRDIYGGKVNDINPKALANLKLSFDIYRSTMSQLSTFGARSGQRSEVMRHATLEEREQKLSDAWPTIYAVLTHPNGLVESASSNKNIKIVTPTIFQRGANDNRR